MVLPDGLRVSTDSPPGRFALSPNGRQLVIVASRDAGKKMLWIRPLDSSAALPLPGTEGAAFPFWSPDSSKIAFLADTQLKHIEVATGTIRTVCPVTFGATGSWNRDDVILFTPKGAAAIHRVSASGGTPSPVTSLDEARGEVQHWFPFFLPDGQHFLFFAVGTRSGGMVEPGGIYVSSLNGRSAPVQIVEDDQCQVWQWAADLHATRHAGLAAVRSEHLASQRRTTAARRAGAGRRIGLDGNVERLQRLGERHPHISDRRRNPVAAGVVRSQGHTHRQLR